jgi:hypothetical protein
MTKLYKDVNDRYWYVINEIDNLKLEKIELNAKISMLEKEKDVLHMILTKDGKHIVEHFEEGDIRIGEPDEERK